MIALGLLLAVVVVIWLRAAHARKGRASDPEGVVVLVPDSDRTSRGLRYRFPGTRGSM